jgi:hypothetical protein
MHKPKPAPGALIEFGAMPYGTWFTDGSRTFVKLQDVLPSGIRVCYDSFEVEADDEADSREVTAGRRASSMHYNAVDTRGIPGCCPDWLKFRVVADPFDPTPARSPVAAE